MKRHILALVIGLVLHAASASAQATRIIASGTLPSTCTVGNIYLKTGTGAGFYYCLTTNTWSGPPLAGGPVTSSGLTMSTARLLCRTTASTGAIEECSVTSDLSLSSTTLGLGSTINLSSKTLRVPNSTTLPASCTVGDSYMDTDATTAQRWYLCESTNTWVAQGAGSGGTVTTTGSPANGNLAKFTGATSISNADLTGDVTTSGGVATTIANDAVTYAKMQNVSAASRLLCRGDSGSGDVQECTLGSGLAMSGTALSVSPGATDLTTYENTFTDTQIRGWFASPITIVSAPGANKVVVPVELHFSTNLTTGYAQNVSMNLYWNGVNPELVTLGVTGWSNTTTKKFVTHNVVSGANNLTLGENQPLTISNQTAALTGGNSANTVHVTVKYYVVNVN